MTTGPDYSGIDSLPKVLDRLRRGEFEKVLLMPSEFGGQDIPQNVVYVPVGFAAAKSGIDLNIIAPLIRQGKVSRYSATPEYQGQSVVSSVHRSAQF